MKLVKIFLYAYIQNKNEVVILNSWPSGRRVFQNLGENKILKRVQDDFYWGAVK